jgi:hypothetical protein
MEPTAADLTGIITAVLTRFYVQNGQTPPAAAGAATFVARLEALIAERGWPRALAAGETGAPGGPPEVEVAQLAARVAGPMAEPLLQEAARQFVKACFYPEFTACRDSFRAVGPDGACRRQQGERVRGRISGSHCVDCPHWVALDPAGHAEFFAREWRGDPAVLAANHALFLPPDFGAFRRWRHAAARR